MSIKVLLADDHQIFREGLRAMLEKETDIQVVAEADNGRDSLELVDQLKPSVVVMDINMPDLNGMEATRRIVHQSPGTNVLALSMHVDKRFVDGMLKAGACGYVPKDCDRDELVNAIRAAAAGQTYLSPAVAGLVVDSYLRLNDQNTPSSLDVLTAREREVLQLVAEGWASKQIANKLHISVKTVETHRHQIMEKLDIHSIAELTKFALREGLTSLDT